MNCCSDRLNPRELKVENSDTLNEGGFYEKDTVHRLPNTQYFKVKQDG